MSKERRNYFRFDDELELDFQIITEDDKQAIAQGTDPISRYQRLLERMRTLDQDHQDLYQRLKKHDPSMAEYVELLNHKVELIMQSILLSGSKPKSQVNISAGGLGFHFETMISVETTLRIKLVFHPSMQALISIGEVVACVYEPDVSAESPYRIAVEFKEISDTDQQLIMQHIYSKQAEQQRNKKDS